MEWWADAARSMSIFSDGQRVNRPFMGWATPTRVNRDTARPCTILTLSPFLDTKRWYKFAGSG